jgi:putative ABC transport system permease protein
VVTDLRIIVRTFRRSPGFVALAVVSLAIGIGLNTAVFSLINTLFWQSIRGVPEPHRVVLGPRVSGVEYETLRHASTLDGLAAEARVGTRLEIDGVSRPVTVPSVSRNFFATLRVEPRIGRFFTADGAPGADAREAVLDQRFWRDQMGGDPGIVGRTVALDGQPFRVVGVAPESFHGAGPERFPLWVTVDALPSLTRRPDARTDPTHRPFALVGRLRDGQGVEAASAELTLLRRRVAAGTDRTDAPPPITLSAGRESWTAAPSPEKRVELLLVTVVPLVIVGTLLWIACSNVANLLLARGVARRREIAIRLATGASRARIVGWLLLETLLLALAGGAAGILVGGWTLDAVFATFSEFGGIDVTLDTSVLLYTAVISGVATMMAGLLPALDASRADVASVLKADGGGVTGSVRGARLRAAFLSIQIAGALALLLVAGTFVRVLVESHVGRDADRIDRLAVLHVALDAVDAPAAAAIWADGRDALARVPGVAGVTVLGDGADTRATLQAVDGRPVSPVPLALQAIDASYFDAVGARVVRGRGPRPGAGGDHDVVVNEAAARRVADDGSALDRAIALDALRGRIVGIVDDGLRDPRVYRAVPVVVASTATLLVRTEEPSAPLVPRLRDALAPHLPARTRPAAATYRDANLRGLGQITRVGALLSGLGLLLAGAGIYGTMAFHGRQRAREIGVRRALGAGTPAVLALVAWQAGRVTVAGIGLGLMLGWLGTQALVALLGGPAWQFDWAATAGASAVFAATVAAASFAPAWRAARIDPAAVLHVD